MVLAEWLFILNALYWIIYINAGEIINQQLSIRVSECVRVL